MCVFTEFIYLWCTEGDLQLQNHWLQISKSRFIKISVTLRKCFRPELPTLWGHNRNWCIYKHNNTRSVSWCLLSLFSITSCVSDITFFQVIPINHFHSLHCRVHWNHISSYRHQGRQTQSFKSLPIRNVSQVSNLAQFLLLLWIQYIFLVIFFQERALHYYMFLSWLYLWHDHLFHHTSRPHPCSVIVLHVGEEFMC